jgi:hypothetical protein
MANPPSFSGFPIEVITRNCHLLIPGIQRCDGIYYHPVTQRLKQIITQKNGDEIKIEVGDLEVSEPVNLLRSSRAATEWLRNDEVPHLQFYQKKATNPAIEDELEKVVLVIKILSEYDSKMDLVFIYDLTNLGLLGLSASGDLTTSQKDIVAKLIFNGIKMLNVNYIEVVKSREILDEILVENGRKLSELRQSIFDIQSVTGERIIEYCKVLLEKSSKIYSKRFYFADCALAQIRHYSGKLDLLDEVIKKAAVIANGNAALGVDIKIIESHLNFSILETVAEASKIIPGNEFGKEQKYLDHLETVAIKTMQLGEKVTGKNMAKNYGKEMTFPAISAFITSYNINFKNILKKYPNNWPVVRVEFSTIKKLIEPIKPSAPKPPADEGLIEKTG